VLNSYETKDQRHSDLAQAEARADVWIEVNGNKVAYGDDPRAVEEEGKVTFCEREYQRETSEFPADCNDEKCVIEDFIRTKASHGFNWVALHDGGDKTIDVKAVLTRTTTGDATADLVIGARTLTVQPVDVVHDESLSN
jgi:hypothetical protein